MNTKTVENIATAQKTDVMSDVSAWLSYLETAAYNYKHPVDYQILINAYMPDAKACADSQIWSELNRDLSTQNGVPVIDNGRVIHLFNISDTVKRSDGSSRTPWIWCVNDKSLNVDYSNSIDNIITEKYNLKSESFSKRLYELSFDKTADFINDDNPDLFYFVSESVAYCLMHRCCPDEVQPSISNLKYLNQLQFDEVGDIINSIVNDIIKEIEDITKTERQNIINTRRNHNVNNRENGQQPATNKIREGSDLDNRPTSREMPVLSTGSRNIEARRNNSGDDRRADVQHNRIGTKFNGTSESTRNDGSRVRLDSTRDGASVLSDKQGTLEEDSSGSNKRGEPAREVHYPSSELSHEQSIRKIPSTEGTKSAELSSGSSQPENTRNVGLVNRPDERTERGVSTGSESERLSENSTATGNIHNASGRNSTSRDSLRLKETQFEIIGNTEFRYISQKTYRKYDTEDAQKIAEELEKNNILFSGKVAGEKTTLTFSKGNLDRVTEIAAKITEAKEQFATGELENKLPNEYYSIKEMYGETYTLYSLSCNGSLSIVIPYIKTEPYTAMMFSEICKNKEDVQCKMIPFEQMEQMSDEILKDEDSSTYYRIDIIPGAFKDENNIESDTHLVREYIDGEKS